MNQIFRVRCVGGEFTQPVDVGGEPHMFFKVEHDAWVDLTADEIYDLLGSGASVSRERVHSLFTVEGYDALLIGLREGAVMIRVFRSTEIDAANMLANALMTDDGVRTLH